MRLLPHRCHANTPEGERMMKITWEDGECEECGDVMKVPMGLTMIHNECKACQMLAKIERIAYALELQVGIN